MQRVHEVIARARRRLWIVDFIDALTWAAVAALACVAAVRVVQQVFGLSVPWTQTLAATALGAVALALLWTATHRRRTIDVAREVDERAGLREALSTALHCEREGRREGGGDPGSGGWRAAVMETASAAAAGVRVSKVIPILTPRRLPLVMGLALATLVLWITMPRLDVLGRQAQRALAQEQQAQVVAVRQEIEADRQRLDAMLAKAGLTAPEVPTPPEGGHDRAHALDPDSLRRVEVRRLTTLTDQLAAKAQGPGAQQLAAMRQAMRQLRSPGAGPLTEFSRSLARGDFDAARARLEELARRMGDQQLSDGERHALAEQLKNLSDQLKRLSDQQQRAQAELQRAGLDAATAERLAQLALTQPDQLAGALRDAAATMSPEQAARLAEAAEAAMRAARQSGALSQALGQIGQCMGQGAGDQHAGPGGEFGDEAGPGGDEALAGDAGEGLSQAMEALSEMEMLALDMDILDAAMAEARSQLVSLGACLGGVCAGGGQGPGQGQGRGQGPLARGTSGRAGGEAGIGPGLGTGPGTGPGAGAGGEPPQTEFTIERHRARVINLGGPVIGSRLVFGPQIRGETAARFEEAVAAGAADASEALEQMQVPRELHGAVKAYFGRLERRGREQAAEDATPAGDPGAGGASK